jgi:ribosomal protein S18 acetylase RimI-like enzyme
MVMREIPGDSHVVPLAVADILPIVTLAREIWYQHYPGIITVKQIEYMLEQRYSPDSIHAEIRSASAHWVKLLIDGALGGFASYETNRVHHAVKLDKLYVHGRFRGRGCGAALARYVEQAARAQGCDRVYLQVNRNNFDSIAAYRRFGFEVVEQLKTDIGGGFCMDDYLMSKTL